MTVTSGKLRNRVVLLRKVRTRDSNGGFQTVWQPVGDPIAAQVEGISGNESIIAQALQGVSFYRIVLRYRPDITDADQLGYGALTLNIRSAVDPDGRRRETLILADTGSPQKVA
jgi:SPP1 family predicted phage head-tail adaptor